MAILLAGTLLNLLKNEPPPPSEVTLLDDRFDTGLDNWSQWEEIDGQNARSSYVLQWASNTAMISGDGYVILSGMQKVVDLSDWNGSGALLLSFDWRATSRSSSSVVTNAVLMIRDADSSSSLFVESLMQGGTLDTGWRNYANDISQYVRGHYKIRIILRLNDAWSENYQQTNTYDNIKLTSTTLPYP